MLNNLHFFGTSHTYGGGFEFHCKPKVRQCYGSFDIAKNENAFSYVGILDDMLDSNFKVHNHSKCGYGNELLYRKVFEIIEAKHFNKETDILFLEFSDVGRKELWNNELNDYVIINYDFQDSNNFSHASTYWYDSKEIENFLNKNRDFYKNFIGTTLNLVEQVKQVQRNCILLVNFLQKQNIKFYITNGFPIIKRTQEKLVDFTSNLIEYEFLDKKGKLIKGNHFVQMTEPHYHITQETDGYYKDFHQGLFVNKIVAKTLYNRLIDDKILDSEKQKIDFGEWELIRKKISEGISLI